MSQPFHRESRFPCARFGRLSNPALRAARRGQAVARCEFGSGLGRAQLLASLRADSTGFAGITPQSCCTLGPITSPEDAADRRNH